MNQFPQPDPCITTDRLAAFAGNRLESEERRAVMTHVAKCIACRDKLSSGKRRVPGSLAGLFSFTSVAIITIVVGIVTLAISGGVTIIKSMRAPKVGIATLVQACGEVRYRPVEGRLSGGFAYRPVGDVQRGLDSPPDPGELRLSAAISEVLSVAPASHAAGVASLLDRDDNDAVATFESAVRAHPNDPELLNDLSAAYHARATAQNRASDYAAALDTAERAWRIKKVPETAWNRAVAISALVRGVSARQAWDDFLRIELDSQWRAEATSRKRELSVPDEAARWREVEPQLVKIGPRFDAVRLNAARHFPARARAFVEDRLIPLWADAHLHDSDAEAGLRKIATDMAATLRSNEDLFASDALAAIDSSCRLPGDCDAIARAHLRYMEGVTFFDAQEISSAAAAFDDARPIFERVHSPYALLASFRGAACLLHANEFARATRDARSLLATVDRRPYRALRARVLWLCGLADLHAARPLESIEHYKAALELFAADRDVTNVASMELLLADAFEYAGDRDIAMQHRLTCFQAMQESGDTKQLDLVLFEAGASATQEGRLSAGDYLLEASTRQAVARRRFVIAAMASMWRSALAARRQEFDHASEQARLALLYSDETKDTGQRALLTASANQIALPATPTRGDTEKLTQTIDFFERAGNRAWLPQLLLQRALAHQRAGEGASAEADLRRSVDIAEETLAGAAPATMRDGFAIDIRENFERLIAHLLQRDAIQDALAVAARARLIGSGPHPDRKALEVIRTMPPATFAAVLELQADTLVVWLVSRNSIEFYRSRFPAGVLQNVQSHNMSEEPLRASLYDILMRGWILHVPHESRLVILPPPALAAVPFGALIDRESGRATIDDYVVSVARALEPLGAVPIRVTRNDAALIVGDPAYRALPRLRSSRDEAIAIAHEYLHPVLLVGADATEANVKAQLGHASLFHFGGHAVANDVAPELSTLMLAGEDGNDTRLYVHDLLQQRQLLKLAVLAACSTARAPSADARGNLSVARAFLDRGAQMVIATHWSVSDSVSAEFSRSLHEALLRGDDVPTASRFAQLRARHAHPADPTWAAFGVFQ